MNNSSELEIWLLLPSENAMNGGRSGYTYGIKDWSLAKSSVSTSSLLVSCCCPIELRCVLGLLRFCNALISLFVKFPSPDVIVEGYKLN
jgi:hypothetical protein